MNQREAYRIPYPLSERPTLQAEEREYEVIDCSSSGLRFVLPFGGSPPPVGTLMRGRVRFRRGAEVEIQGVVIWTKHHEAGLRFHDSEIPFGVLMDEQRYLRAHYPMWP